MLRTVRLFVRRYYRHAALLVIGGAVLISLYSFRLGTLVSGLSPIELAGTGSDHSIQQVFNAPFNIILSLLHLVVFKSVGHDGALLLRLPGVALAVASVGLFALLVKNWLGTRTAMLATTLFACNAWLLHISRLATNDIVYFFAVLILLVLQLAMLKRARNAFVWYGSIIVCSLLLYTPGLIWLVLLSLFWQRAGIKKGWQRYRAWWQRALYVLGALIWLPPLVYYLLDWGHLQTWLGLPNHYGLATIARQLLFVPIHVFVRGPHDPERWLGHAPILSIFSLAMAIIGIWFYVTHLRATRSRVLASYALVGWILVGLGGSVGLSLLVPLAYLCAATGIAYLLREWLQVFPKNPVARRLGIGLVAVAVAVSCSYNLRAYYVAWPHATETLTTVHQRP